MVYVKHLCWQLSSRIRVESSSILILLASCMTFPVWHKPLLCVQWETPDDGQRNCPKYVELHSKNKFDKLVHLVGFYYMKIASDLQFIEKLFFGTLYFFNRTPTCIWTCVVSLGATLFGALYEIFVEVLR